MTRCKLVHRVVTPTLETLLRSKRRLLLERQTIVVTSLVAQKAPQTRAIVVLIPLHWS